MLFKWEQCPLLKLEVVAEQCSMSMEKEFAAFPKFMLAVVPSRLEIKWRLDPSRLGAQWRLDLLLAVFRCATGQKLPHGSVTEVCARQEADLWIVLRYVGVLHPLGGRKNCY